MTDRELSKLRRTELLEILIAQGKENASLQEQLKQTEKALHKRELAIEKTGSVAEVAFRLNDVVGSTQRAVDLYIENVQRVMEQQQEESTDVLIKARDYATQTVAYAEKRSRTILGDAEAQAAQILTKAQAEADRIIAQATADAAAIRTKAQQEGQAFALLAQTHSAAPLQQAAPQQEKKRGLFKSRH